MMRPLGLGLTIGITLVMAATPASAEQWMFDTKPITVTAPAAGTVSFKWTDRIYARVFFDAPVKDVLKLADKDGHLKVYQRMDAGPDDQVAIWIPKARFDDS